jgi:hypothetical protein
MGLWGIQHPPAEHQGVPPAPCLSLEAPSYASAPQAGVLDHGRQFLKPGGSRDGSPKAIQGDLHS